MKMILNLLAAVLLLAASTNAFAGGDGNGGPHSNRGHAPSVTESAREGGDGNGPRS